MALDKVRLFLRTVQMIVQELESTLVATLAHKDEMQGNTPLASSKLADLVSNCQTGQTVSNRRQTASSPTGFLAAKNFCLLLAAKNFCLRLDRYAAGRAGYGGGGDRSMKIMANGSRNQSKEEKLVWQNSQK